MCFPLGLEYIYFCEPYQFFDNEEVYRPSFMHFLNVLGDWKCKGQICDDFVK